MNVSVKKDKKSLDPKEYFLKQVYMCEQQALSYNPYVFVSCILRLTYSYDLILMYL